MKCLKIENTSEALELTRCLIGSVVEWEKKTSGDDDTTSIFGRGLLVASPSFFCVDICSVDQYKKGVSCKNFKNILIPIDTIKLNLYNAMENDISVVCLNKYSGEEFDGKIKSIDNRPTPESNPKVGYEFKVSVSVEQQPFRSIEHPDSKRKNHFGGGCWLHNGTVTLDLEPIERGEINGVIIIDLKDDAYLC